MTKLVLEKDEDDDDDDDVNGMDSDETKTEDFLPFISCIHDRAAENLGRI